jgi:hypothetical protein
MRHGLYRILALQLPSYFMTLVSKQTMTPHVMTFRVRLNIPHSFPKMPLKHLGKSLLAVDISTSPSDARHFHVL